MNLRGSATKGEDRFRRVPLRIRSGTLSAAFTASVNTARVKSAQARHEAAHQQQGEHTIQESPSMHTHTRVPSGIPPSRSSFRMTFRWSCAASVATKSKVDSFINWTRERTSWILYSMICQHARVSMETTRSMQTTLASASTVDKQTNRKGTSTERENQVHLMGEVQPNLLWSDGAAAISSVRHRSQLHNGTGERCSEAILPLCPGRATSGPCLH